MRSHWSNMAVWPNRPHKLSQAILLLSFRRYTRLMVYPNMAKYLGQNSYIRTVQQKKTEL